MSMRSAVSAVADVTFGRAAVESFLLCEVIIEMHLLYLAVNTVQIGH